MWSSTDRYPLVKMTLYRGQQMVTSKELDASTFPPRMNVEVTKEGDVSFKTP